MTPKNGKTVFYKSKTPNQTSKPVSTLKSMQNGLSSFKHGEEEVN